MRLRTKITLWLAAVLGTLMLLNYAVQRFGVYPTFLALERQQAMRDWSRCHDAIRREIENLSMLAFDWGSWTDTYEYVQGKQPGFYDMNLSNEEWFVDQKLEVLMLCRPDGTVYWSRIADRSTRQPVDVRWLPPDRLPPAHPLLAVKADKNSLVSGLVLTELGPMMVAARPILTSQYEGPMAGVLIFGRVLDAELLDALKAQTHVDFYAWPVNSPAIEPADRQLMQAAAQDGELQVAQRSPSELVVVGVLKDLDDAPVLMVRTDLARDIAASGKHALQLATLSLGIVAALTLLVLLAVMRWLVVRPLARLTEHTTDVAASGDMQRRLNLDRRDEIGLLSTAFDRMLAQLADYRASSMQMSRQAGMAEIATNVLHNVGNVLTNANVLTENMSDKLGHSKVPNLVKAVSLIGEHQADLGQFLDSDQRGRQLAAYLIQLSEHLHGETNDLQRDLVSLTTSLQHLKEIVAAQQCLAKGSTIIEPVDLEPLVRGVLTVMEPSMARHKVRVEFEAQPLPTIRCDRAKLSQTLTNLLTNAKDAVREADPPQRTIRVRLLDDQQGHALLEVIDNGIGIKPENLTRIFGERFTTKPKGHGFGLHYSALAAREMGGLLQAHSEGPGQGATFRLRLPIQPGVKEVDH